MKANPRMYGMGDQLAGWRKGARLTRQQLSVKTGAVRRRDRSQEGQRGGSMIWVPGEYGDKPLSRVILGALRGSK